MPDFGVCVAPETSAQLDGKWDTCPTGCQWLASGMLELFVPFASILITCTGGYGVHRSAIAACGTEDKFMV